MGAKAKHPWKIEFRIPPSSTWKMLRRYHIEETGSQSPALFVSHKSAEFYIQAMKSSYPTYQYRIVKK